MLKPDLLTQQINGLMIVTALVLPDASVGIIDASPARSSPVPNTRIPDRLPH